MRWPCRCSSSKCRARVTLARHPAQYVREPKCAQCGAELRVDQYRRRRGPKDHPPACTDSLCGLKASHISAKGTGASVLLHAHRVSNRGCSGYEEYKLSLSGVQAGTDEPPF